MTEIKFNIPSYFDHRSKRLRFRKLTRDDIPTWRHFFDNNPNLPYLGLDFRKSHDDLAKEWIEKQLERYDESGLGNLAIELIGEQKLFALGGIIPRDLEGGLEYEIAYSIMPSHWRRGYGTEIAKHLKDFGFAHNISKKFVSIIHKENIGSQKVALNNGMTIEREMEYLGMPVYVYSAYISSEAKRI